MNTGIQDELERWIPYFGFVGTGAVTLLALLFVAVSLRLNIFRDVNVADVRDFARLTLFCFLAPMVISGLSLMPHEQPLMLATPLFVLSAVGVVATLLIVREWLRLNRTSAPDTPGFKPGQWQVWLYVGLVGLSYLSLTGAAALILSDHGRGFVFLAVVDGWMLLTGTVNAWIMLTNAGGSADV